MYRQIFLLILLSLLFGSGFNSLCAQAAVVSSGGDTSGQGGTVAYSIGQVVYTNFSGETGSVNLGVQQPYDVIMVSTSEPETGLTATIYPNPTTSAIRIDIEETVFSSGPDLLAYGLYDPQGKLLLHDRILASPAIVFMDRLVGSVYFLRITRNNEVVKTFKIFKTN